MGFPYDECIDTRATVGFGILYYLFDACNVHILIGWVIAAGVTSGRIDISPSQCSDYDIPRLVVTSYAGGFRYWVCFYGWRYERRLRADVLIMGNSAEAE